jgi:hypothetical protein
LFNTATSYHVFLSPGERKPKEYSGADKPQYDLFLEMHDSTLMRTINTIEATPYLDLSIVSFDQVEESKCSENANVCIFTSITLARSVATSD